MIQRPEALKNAILLPSKLNAGSPPSAKGVMLEPSGFMTKIVLLGGFTTRWNAILPHTGIGVVAGESMTLVVSPSWADAGLSSQTSVAAVATAINTNIR